MELVERVNQLEIAVSKLLAWKSDMSGCNKCDNPDDCHPDCPHQPESEDATLRALEQHMVCGSIEAMGVADSILRDIKAGKVPGVCLSASKYGNIADAEKEIADLKAKLDYANREREALMVERNTFKEQRDIECKLTESLNKSIDGLNEDLAKCRADLAAATKDHITFGTSQLPCSQTVAEAAKATFSELNNRIRHLEADCARARSVKALGEWVPKSEYDKLEQHFNEAAATIKRLQSDLAACRERHDKLAQYGDTADAEIDRFKSELAAAKAELNGIGVQEFQRMSAALDTERKRSQTLEKYLAAAKADLDAAVAKLEASNSAEGLRQIKAALAEAKADAERAKSERNKLSNAYDELVKAGDIERWRKLNKEANDARAELASVTADRDRLAGLLKKGRPWLSFMQDSIDAALAEMDEGEIPGAAAWVWKMDWCREKGLSPGNPDVWERAGIAWAHFGKKANA